MMIVGEDPKRKIEEYSQKFKQDFLYLLRTGHGEKKISANRFYQEYIQNKNHIHMNATKWVTLTEFVRFLGRNGICRVSEDDKDGLTIAWVDNSPEAMARQEAARKKERSAKNDELTSKTMLDKQIETAKIVVDETRQMDVQAGELKRSNEDEPVQLALGQLKTNVKATPVKQKTGNVFGKLRSVKDKAHVTKPTARKDPKPLNAFERVMLKDQTRH
jgi:DNA/RNA-binding protein KIN17